jgi:hypothetical protein
MFSFTNSLYDSCSLSKKQQESEGPGLWSTDSNIKESNDACFQKTSPFMHNPFRNAVPDTAIHIENDLRNQNRILSRCPEEKFPKLATNKIDFFGEKCKTDFLTPSYTRINKPCNTLSGININRFHPLYEDLQTANKIHHNSYIGINSRLAVKDAFKKL